MERLFKILADDEYYFPESGLNGIIDLIIHDGFTMRPEAIELFQSSITAAHAGSQNE